MPLAEPPILAGKDCMMELTVYFRAANPSIKAWINKIGNTLCEGMVAQRLARVNGKTYMENRASIAAM
ncbi:hypothetical protein NLG97_g2522 [Lecanicillium saksenae]|uniref:Uncharacterized protein n=1 Tax=Lecanicillium saksenae TaxID=468837 RepID=A0ACC1R3A3_9HYPO|nr:hypothetical protein NLG97_g2522 [Lecanicillium saksenae]